MNQHPSAHLSTTAAASHARLSANSADPSTMTPLSKNHLAEAITHAAKHLGFSAVGFVSWPALQHSDHWQTAGQHLFEWLKEGYHADMDWLPRYADERLDPHAILPNTQTIVVVALNYHQNGSFNQPNTPEHLKIAEYAWGKDYHKLIRKRLQKLLKQIQQWVPEANGRPVTDSAPLLEKPLAQAAGLGWQGKNTLLIHPKHGSTFFLGELLLDITFPLPETPTIGDHCGSCTRCLDACPTDAFPQAGVLDSNRCIAYWTIETEADQHIPEDIAKNQQGWLFGCDICQQVCPWNQRFAQSTTDTAFTPPRPLAQFPTGEAFRTMTEAEFTTTFANSPLRRTGLARLQATLQQMNDVSAITPPH